VADSALVPVHNSFGVLKTAESVIDCEAGADATPVEVELGSKPRAAGVACVACGRKLSGSCGAKCARCANHSFEGLASSRNCVKMASV
jgi:hypothetical protein